MSVKVDIKELKKFQEKIKKMESQSDEIVKLCVEDLAQRMYRLVNRLTPIDTGLLRESWTLGAITKIPNGYQVELTNIAESISGELYAKFVEYGHRIVVDDITIGWVEGKFMMTIAESEIDKQKDRIVKRRVEEWLKERFK